jgi:hypothetical protein
MRFVRTALNSDDTIAFVLDALRKGEQLLRLVANRFAAGRIELCAYAPEGIERDRLEENWKWSLVGDRVEGRVPTADASGREALSPIELLSGLMVDDCLALRRATFVIEDQMRSRSDPVEQRSVGDKVFLGDRIYRVLSCKEPQANRFSNVLFDSDNSVRFAVLRCDMERSALPAALSEIDLRVLGVIADTCTWMALTAYDGDGLIVAELRET